MLANCSFRAGETKASINLLDHEDNTPQTTHPQKIGMSKKQEKKEKTSDPILNQYDKAETRKEMKAQQDSRWTAKSNKYLEYVFTTLYKQICLVCRMCLDLLVHS